MSKKTQLIVALDTDSKTQAMEIVSELGDSVEWYKVGKQLFTIEGPSIVRELKNLNKKVFLDLKFHDIPNTVAQAVIASAGLGADMINFHASGGSKMIKTAVTECRKINQNVLLIAVTVLTSMDQESLAEIGLNTTPLEQVLRLAKISELAGANGVVASSHEAEEIKNAANNKNFITVIPGIRPAGSQLDDQKRVMTPTEAAKKGVDFIVVGRPITKAENRQEAAKNIQNELLLF